MEKVKLPNLAQDDLALISNAAHYYNMALQNLCNAENRGQQHIHLSILNELRFDILKKITKREPAEKTTLNLELHTAFVLYDSLQHYSRDTENHLEGAICRRLIMELFSLLPFTKDHQHLSVMSDLNFN